MLVCVCLRGFSGCPPARSDPTYDGKKLCGSFRFLCKLGRKTAETLRSMKERRERVVGKRYSSFRTADWIEQN